MDIVADEGLQTDLTRFLTPQVLMFLAIAAGVLILFLMIGGLVLVRAARRKKWLNPQAVKRGILAVKAQTLPPGTAREMAQLRLQLSTQLRQTRQMLEQAGEGGRSVGELPRMFARVEQLAQILDSELGLQEMQAKTGQDPEDARSRTEEVLSMLMKIRRAATGSVDDEAGGELRTLQTDLDLELSALGEGVKALRRLGPGGS